MEYVQLKKTVQQDLRAPVDTRKVTNASRHSGRDREMNDTLLADFSLAFTFLCSSFVS